MVALAAVALDSSAQHCIYAPAHDRLSDGTHLIDPWTRRLADARRELANFPKYRKRASWAWCDRLLTDADEDLRRALQEVEEEQRFWVEPRG